MNDRVVAIILNWKSAEDSAGCAASLLEIGRPLDIILVDNASNDDSLSTIRRKLVAADAHIVTVDDQFAWPAGPASNVILLQAERNGGYAYGNNLALRLALKHSSADYFWILNSDTRVPDSSSLDALIARMKGDPAIGICGSSVLYLEDSNVIQTQAGGSFDPETGRSAQIGSGLTLAERLAPDEVEKQLAYINGAATFVSRRFVQDIGFMNENYFLYYEELDWAFRGKQKYGLGYAPDSVVLHRVGGAIGTRDQTGRSTLADYYLTRSKIRFVSKFAPRARKSMALDILREVKSAIRKGRWRNGFAVIRAAIGLPFSR